MRIKVWQAGLIAFLVTLVVVLSLLLVFTKC